METPQSATNTPPRYQLSTQINTDRAKRYLHRLCKHFSHKVPAKWSECSGTVSFAMGQCAMTASELILSLRCEASNAKELDEIVDTIERHYLRFSGDVDTKLTWSVV